MSGSKSESGFFIKKTLDNQILIATLFEIQLMQPLPTNDKVHDVKSELVGRIKQDNTSKFNHNCDDDTLEIEDDRQDEIRLQVNQVYPLISRESLIPTEIDENFVKRYNKIITPYIKSGAYFNQNTFIKPRIGGSSQLSVLMEKKRAYRYRSETNNGFIQYYNQFVQEVNISIQKLNSKIEPFNDLTLSEEARLSNLKVIYAELRLILKQHSNELIKYCPSFKIKFHEGLFNQIQTQSKLLGIPSMDVLEACHKKAQPSQPALDLFKHILSNMEPKKVEKLLNILIQAAELNEFQKKHPKEKVQIKKQKISINNLIASKFKSLYTEEKIENKEFQTFLQLLDTIKFLGGCNSLNFKITFNDGSLPLVLKVDNRLGNPSTADDFLRKKVEFQNIFTPIFAERQVSTELKGELITRTLMLTEFCERGDLLDATKTLNAQDRVKYAPEIFQQMGKIYKLLLSNHCGHSDPKLENFLLTATNVCLADTKGIVFLTQEQQFDVDTMAKDWYRLINTKHMNPPEFTRKKHFDAGKVASYMFGKAMYQFLAKAPYTILDDQHDGEKLHFDPDIFASDHGEVFQFLIMNLVKSNPNHRTSISKALVALEDMNYNLSFKKHQCWYLLECLLTIKEDDYQYMYAEIKNATLKELPAIELRLSKLEKKELCLLTERKVQINEFLNHMYVDCLDDPYYIHFKTQTDAATLEDVEGLVDSINKSKLKLDEKLKLSQEICRKHLRKIQSCSLSIDDQHMELFIQSYNTKIDTASNYSVGTIKDELKRIYFDIAPVTTHLKDYKSPLWHKIPVIISKILVEHRGKNILLFKCLGKKLLQQALSSYSRPGVNKENKNMISQKIIKHGVFKTKPSKLVSDRVSPPLHPVDSNQINTSMASFSQV
ncbi:MAG: hypothetical protein H0U75_04490 [Legionella sp.]|nr:hypothetical protein [Legionella sp.]